MYNWNLRGFYSSPKWVTYERIQVQAHSLTSRKITLNGGGTSAKLISVSGTLKIKPDNTAVLYSFSNRLDASSPSAKEVKPKNSGISTAGTKIISSQTSLGSSTLGEVPSPNFLSSHLRVWKVQKQQVPVEWYITQRTNKCSKCSHSQQPSNTERFPCSACFFFQFPFCVLGHWISN